MESVAHTLEKKGNVYFMVTSHTKESAERQLKEGIYPDMLSSGMGIEGLPDVSREAVPWCHGYYFFFCKEDNFSAISSENTVLSVQENVSSEVAARLWGLDGELKSEPSLTAYVSFLNGKARYLLGTQRDYFRLKSREEVFFFKPVEVYSDLIQWFSILTDDERILPTCRAYLEELLSEQTQKRLSSIGMFGEGTEYEDEIALSPLKGLKVRYTLPYYVSNETIRELKDLARKNGDENFLKNYLKGVDS
ncbi:MAG: hypothetical protein J6D37_02850 [Clostridia bacterium]|nr:hypothetical protein [Clostridia bacterium]